MLLLETLVIGEKTAALNAFPNTAGGVLRESVKARTLPLEGKVAGRRPDG